MSTTQINKNELKDWIESLESETVSVEQILGEIEDLLERKDIKEARNRLKRYREGKTGTVSGEQVEKKYKKRFGR
jgi:hypothetical protein